MHSQRSDITRNQPQTGRGLARQLHPGAVNVSQPVLQAMPGKFIQIRAKSIGQQDLSPGFPVLGMDAQHNGRVAQVQFIKAPVKGNAARMQQRAHGAIRQDRRRGSLEQGKEFTGHCGPCFSNWPTRLSPVV